MIRHSALYTSGADWIKTGDPECDANVVVGAEDGTLGMAPLAPPEETLELVPIWLWETMVSPARPSHGASSPTAVEIST